MLEGVLHVMVCDLKKRGISYDWWVYRSGCI